MMHQSAKIQFSQVEQNLMVNADWILTKNGIIEKLKLLLQQCEEAQKEILSKSPIALIAELFITPPKISRGENYKGLPWLMLDYPRYFEKENSDGRPVGVFAIRTFFWWGNCFSITLHLSGFFQTLFAEKIIAARKIFCLNDFYTCINETEWEHHFNSDNYIKAGGMSPAAFELMIHEKKFIKLAQQFEIGQWEQLPDLTKTFNEIIVKVLD